MAAFETTRKILFQHCDPAGIVFYPRYFEMLNSVVEEWFEDGLGVSFDVFHRVRRRGIPTKHVEMDFAAPCRLGETITFSFGVEVLRGAGITAKFEARGPDNDTRLSGRQILVHVDLDRLKPTPFPDDMRAAIARYTIDDSETPS
jgi:4-hydroxybenzoyl-CoA thioesterase